VLSFGPAAGFDADYEIPGMTLPQAGATLALEFGGVTLAKVSWDATWPVAARSRLRPNRPRPASSRPSGTTSNSRRRVAW